MLILLRKLQLTIDDTNPSYASASLTVNVLSTAGSADDRLLGACKAPSSSCVAGEAVAAPSAAAVTVSSKAKSASGTRFTLLTNQPSAVDTCNEAAESTSPPKSCYSGVNHMGSREKLGLKRASKASR